jgi:hypothetical protein
MDLEKAQQAVSSVVPPERSDIRVSIKDEGLVFEVPPAGPRRGLLIEALAGVLLASVAFLKGLVFHSILATPAFFVFALAGLAFVPALYRMALEERICLGLQKGKIERSLGPWRWQVPFQIGALKVEVEEGILSGRCKLTLESRCSAQYVEVQRLLAGRDLAEKRWVASCINEWIRSTAPGS